MSVGRFLIVFKREDSMFSIRVISFIFPIVILVFSIPVLAQSLVSEIGS